MIDQPNSAAGVDGVDHGELGIERIDGFADRLIHVQDRTLSGQRDDRVTGVQ